MLLNRGEGRAATPLIHSAPNVCNFAQTRALPRRAIAPLKGDQHDHDRAGVPRQRASMPVLGRVGERSGKQGRFLRPRRDLGRRCRSDRARRADREIDSRRTSAPSDGRGLTVPDGPGDQQRHRARKSADWPRDVSPRNQCRTRRLMGCNGSFGREHSRLSRRNRAQSCTKVPRWHQRYSPARSHRGVPDDT
jgi:hypothetical protein